MAGNVIISGKYKKWQGYFVSVMKRYFSTTIRPIIAGRVPLAGKYGLRAGKIKYSVNHRVVLW